MTKPSISVAVLVSAGRHPLTGSPRACRGDCVALALGRSLAGEALRVIHAGSPDELSLQDYLAVGAGTIEVLRVEPGGDVLPEIAAHAQGIDVILMGWRTEFGAGSGLLPYALAHRLGRPVIANVLDIAIENSASNGSQVKLRQFLPKGQRRRIACPLPAVIAVHPAAPVELSYAYARRTSGRIVPVTVRDLAEQVLPSPWTVVPATRRAVRLKAEEKKAGHARMLSAIASEAKAGVVAFEGTSVDKAQVVLNYLRENNLVDF